MLDVIVLWVIIFIGSLYILIRGADYVVEHSEKIGLSFGLSPFVIGVLIVGIGTSLPELVAALAAILQNTTEIVVANAVGSNIANILLVLGVTAVITKNISVQKNLVYLDIPLLLSATIIFLGVALGKEMLTDGSITPAITKGEAIFLIATYGIYLGYSLFHRDNYYEKLKEIFETHPEATWKNYAFLVAGFAGIIFGAKFAIDSIVVLSEALSIGVGVITMFALAAGTSLPELTVALRGTKAGKPEIAVGNIFGSNVFNILMLVGIPGLFTNLHIGESTMAIGLPALAAATLLISFSGISNKVNRWDGGMLLMLYLLFVAKLFGIF